MYNFAWSWSRLDRANPTRYPDPDVRVLDPLLQDTGWETLRSAEYIQVLIFCGQKDQHGVPLVSIYFGAIFPMTDN